MKLDESEAAIGRICRERDEARAALQSALESNASLNKEAERYKRRELRAYEERDEARAELERACQLIGRATRETDEARAEIEVWRGKLAEQCGQTLQAHAIARRLRAALESDQHADMLSDAWFRAVEEAKAACAAFDALPWAKDDPTA